MSKLKLYIAERNDFSNEVFQELETRFEIIDFKENISIKEILKQVDIFWFRLAHKLDSTVLDKSTKCKYLLTPVTGIDHIDEKLCNELGIQIICLRGEVDFLKNVRATAEHTIALTLALLRKIHPAVSDVQSGNWNRDNFRGYELYEKKVGILGYGRLGQIVARYFHAFDCEISYFDIEEKIGDTFCVKLNSIESLFGNNDIVSLHIPLNEKTIGIINKDLLQQMKVNSILVNTSRGAIINEIDLLEVLKFKSIKGAALDVLEGEPNIQNSELVKYSKSNSNLIITPHIG
ncbi:MAG: D-isomer specific 2-hydroxyacid dehydrogenase family protein, partial [Saprospiraceae bacterium]